MTSLVETTARAMCERAVRDTSREADETVVSAFVGTMWECYVPDALACLTALRKEAESVSPLIYKTALTLFFDAALQERPTDRGTRT